MSSLRHLASRGGRMVRLLLAAVGALAAAVLMVGGAGASSGTTGRGASHTGPRTSRTSSSPATPPAARATTSPSSIRSRPQPGSATNMTWRFVLPTDGAVPVSAVGPTFWFGGTVTDPNPKDFFGEGFLEVQFYPDGILRNCTPNGGFVLDPRAERVHGVHAGLVDPHDRPEAGVPRAGRVQRDADDRSRSTHRSSCTRATRSICTSTSAHPATAGTSTSPTRRRTRAAPSS